MGFLPTKLVRRAVMVMALCQLLAFVLIRTFTPAEPERYYGPFINDFVLPLFGVTWWILMILAVEQGIMTWWEE